MKTKGQEIVEQWLPGAPKTGWQSRLIEQIDAAIEAAKDTNSSVSIQAEGECIQTEQPVDSSGVICPSCGESRYYNKGVCLACKPKREFGKVYTVDSQILRRIPVKEGEEIQVANNTSKIIRFSIVTDIEVGGSDV